LPAVGERWVAEEAAEPGVVRRVESPEAASSGRVEPCTGEWGQ
jgi:hypothetical protein